MNIEVLFQKPELNQKAVLFIEPLTPLSLVSSLPGAYYRSQREPSNFMIYGMLENLLGWHFSNEGNDKTRSTIVKKVKDHHKKNNKLILEFDKSGVGFIPLLQHHIYIDKLLLKPKEISSYEDYWTQHLKDVDSRHVKGVRNFDYRIIPNVIKIKQIKGETEQNAEYDKLMKLYPNYIPTYYQSPTVREYIEPKGKYGYAISSKKEILNLLLNAIDLLEYPIYLGNSEGWINIKIEII